MRYIEKSTESSWCALYWAVTFFSIATLCQEARSQQKGMVTGLDIFVDQLTEGCFDRPYSARGVVYEVIGIAGLRPAEGATVRGRVGGKWTKVTTDARGIFDITIRVPADPDFGADSTPNLEIEIQKGRHKREYEFPLSLRSPFQVVARTDRREYEPGEIVRFWSRVDDTLTGRPLAGVPVVITPSRESRREMVTGASGVAAMDFQLSSTEEAGHQSITINAGDQVYASAGYVVGNRPTTDLLITAKSSPETVGPGEPVSISVEVRSTRGSPVRGAEVSIDASLQKQQGTTDANGIATFKFRAPAYSADHQGSVKITGTARHAGYRSADFSGGFEIRRPSSLEVDLLAPHGGLVPGVNEKLIVSVETEDGAPLKAGTPIELRSSAFNGGSVKATVDRFGFASVTIRLTPGDYSRHMGSDLCASQSATTIKVVVKGKDKDATSIEQCMPVLESALVAPFVRRPALSPGESIEVTVERRPEAATLPVSVELSCSDFAGALDAKVAAPSSNTVRLTAPDDRLGVCTVRARPMLDVTKSPTFGLGASESVLVRPSVPSFPTIEPDREQYSIKGRAVLKLHSPAGAKRSWVAVLARDLAQHQEEVPFDEYFMNRALQQAVLDPSTPNADLLVRAALVAYASIDENAFLYPEYEAPGPPSEYDAARLAVSMRNQTAGEWMVAVEALLKESLDSGTINEITVGKGAARRFRRDAVDLALEGKEEPALTLGQGKVTTDMLTELDPSFNFNSAARRVTRSRLVRLLSALSTQLNAEENDESRPRGRSTEPPDRWLSELVRQGVLSPSDLLDPWGNTFVIRRTDRESRFVLAVEAEGYELLSPGSDGRLGTADDVSDPFQRAIPQSTIYAKACGEDHLMAQLSAISPGSIALQHLLEAYDRLTDEAIEELIGDGLVMTGSGGGGGSGSGSGYGSGRLGSSHKTRAPAMRSGAAGIAGMSLAGMLREDFPSTLYFNPDAPVSPSGRTTFEIPLAQAATTYIVEAILWRADGWAWSTSTKIRVDQDFVIDAPLPEAAVVGDNVDLPVRMANRTDKARTVRISVTGSNELGISPIETKAVKVPPRDSIEVPVMLPLRSAASGKVTIAAFDTSNKPIDAVRRRILVKPCKRRAHDQAQGILRRKGSVSLIIPKGAEPLGTNQIFIAVGPAVFRTESDSLWDRWLNGFSGRVEEETNASEQWEMSELAEGKDPLALARLIGAEWLNKRVQDKAIGQAVEVLADHIDKIDPKDVSSVRLLSRVLMLLAPAALHIDERRAISRPLSKSMEALRIKVENGAALFADAPWLFARVSAALMWTAQKRHGGNRAEALLKQARSAALTVGEERLLEGGRDDPAGDDFFVASALLALAEVREGNDDAAFELVRSLARLFNSVGGNLPEIRSLDDEDKVMAAAAAAALGKDRSKDTLTIIVDGKRQSVDLEDGMGVIAIPAIGRGGEHRIEVKGAGSNVVMIQATAEYTVDWNTPPVHTGPFFVRIEGRAGRVDDRSGLRLVIRNRIPRAIPKPVVEISLPAGAEVDEQTHQSLAQWTVVKPEVSSDTLTLRLRLMKPKEEIVIPLPWLWTAAGRFSGLGVTAWSAERPQAVTVLPARNVEAAKRAAATGGTP